MYQKSLRILIQQFAPQAGLGGISGMAPGRRHDLSRLGLLAMWGGALSSLMTACVVGVLL